MKNINFKGITFIINLLIKEWYYKYAISPKEINNGDCDRFADKLANKINEQGEHCNVLCSELFFDIFAWRDYQIQDISIYGNKPTNFNRIGLPAHFWVYSNGKHYDSECPEGEENVFNMPIMKRFYTI